MGKSEDSLCGIIICTCNAAMIFQDPASAELIAEYERECANPLLGPCAPQPEMYASLEEQGAAQCFAAYKDQTLIGFAFVLTTPLPHYELERKFATVESFFVASVARHTGCGRYLMEGVENYCRAVQCEAIFFSVPVNTRLARLMLMSGDKYTNTGHIFCRGLR